MFFKEDTVNLMKEIVPEFISNNSEYCRLDSQNMRSKVLSDESIPQSSEIVAKRK